YSSASVALPTASTVAVSSSSSLLAMVNLRCAERDACTLTYHERARVTTREVATRRFLVVSSSCWCPTPGNRCPTPGRILKEGAMYATLRTYEMAADWDDELVRHLNEGFISQVAQVPGFVAYYSLEAG